MLEKGYTFQREGKLVRVKGRFLPDILVQQRVPEVEIVLGAAKGYAPVRMTASTANYTEEVQVLEWKQVGGMKSRRGGRMAEVRRTIAYDSRGHHLVLQAGTHRVRQVAHTG